MRFGRRIIGGRAVVGGRRPFRSNFISAPRSWTYSPTDDLIGLMRKSLGFHSAVTAALLILRSASGSNAEPDAAIEHAPEPVEAAQGPNITVVPDHDTNVSTAQTENDAAKIIPSVSIAPASGPSTWYFVRVAESSQQRANQLCSRLASVGGSCLVSRN
jgi:hypothetical protein